MYIQLASKKQKLHPVTRKLDQPHVLEKARTLQKLFALPLCARRRETRSFMAFLHSLRFSFARYPAPMSHRFEASQNNRYS